MKKAFWIAGLSALFLVVGYVCIAYYPYVFAKTVSGRILRVEPVAPAVQAIVTSSPGGGNNAGSTQSNLPAQVFSFAVAIRDEKGEIHTSSTEDRQWAVAQAGQCVKATFFPYAPWKFEKSGTFHGARLEKLYDCPPSLLK